MPLRVSQGRSRIRGALQMFFICFCRKESMSFLGYYSLHAYLSSKFFDINYDIFGIRSPKISRTEENNFSKNNYFPHSDLNKDYLLRRHQDRHNFNHSAKRPYSGLQKRVNREVRNEITQRKAQNEKKIQQAFSRKIKNKTWCKMHHKRVGQEY